MRSKTKKSKLPTKKTVVALLILIIAGALGWLYFTNSQTDSTTNTKASSSSSKGNISLDPPTPQEQEAGDTQKERNIKRDADLSDGSQKRSPNIVVVDASQYDDTVEVRAYISNIYEDGGTCEVTFTKGQARITRSTEAYKDATTTQCKPINIPRGEFKSAGQWQVTVSYSSPTASGSGAQQTITIT